MIEVHLLMTDESKARGLEQNSIYREVERNHTENANDLP